MFGFRYAIEERKEKPTRSAFIPKLFLNNNYRNFGFKQNSPLILFLFCVCVDINRIRPSERKKNEQVIEHEITGHTRSVLV